MNTKNNDMELDIKEFLLVLYRGKLTIALVIVISIVLAAVYTFFAVKPIYESSVTLRIPIIYGNPAYIIPTGVEIANNVKLEEGAPGSVSVHATNVRNANIIKVVFSGNNPQDIKDFGDVYTKAAIESLSKLSKEDPAIRQMISNVSLLNDNVKSLESKNDKEPKNIELFQKKIEESLMFYHKQMEATKVVALNEVALPLQPVNSHKMTILALSICIGVFLGSFIVLIRHSFRNGLK